MDCSFPRNEVPVRGQDCKGFEFKMIPLERLRPNPWNPNKIPRDKYAKLEKAIAEKGLLSPLLVREKRGLYEIVDGEHRWKIARSLNIESIPCFVASLSDTEAKIKTLQLNGLRGENEPERLARLIKDINIEIPVEEMEKVLPMDSYDIKTSLEILDLMEKTQTSETVEQEMQRMLKNVIFSVVVTGEQKNIIEHAILKIKNTARENDKDRSSSEDPTAQSDGAWLAKICERYMYYEK